ncbi:MAG: leucine-rich repeat domain-containing protein [Clostridia bacterium]|nr:leucine-rich repeat domain-containing protein [Clostridia bacterium]
MKKKILSILITILALCTCMFTFTACGENEPPHTHNYEILKHDSENHWFECECEEKNDITAHNIINGQCICGYVLSHTHNYTELKKSETQHWYECTCGAFETKENHKGGTPTETSKAVCSICNQEYGSILGHTHSYDTIITSPKCGEQGYTTYLCVCGDYYIDDYVDALMHSYTNYVYNNDAKCEKDGTKTASCDNGCGTKDTIPATNTALEHTFTKYYSDKNATYESDGTKTANCDNGCGETDTIVDVGSKLEEASPFVFKEYGSGYALYEYTGSDTTITIPSTYNDKPVVAVGIGAYTFSGFYNNTTIINVVLPTSILEINHEAFYGCYNLESIEMPNVLTIKSDAFKNCYNLSIVEMPKVVSIESCAFYNCTSLEEIIISKTCTSIGFNAYYGCNSIKNLTIENFSNITLSGSGISLPSNTLSVGGSGVLTNLSNTGVKNVVVLEGINAIGDDCFRDCTNLQTIIIPNSVNEIGQNAFYNCSKLQNVNLPNSLSKIGTKAFYNCELLEEIVVPKSLNDIPDSAFANCLKLESVLFEEDGNIEINAYAFYNCSSLKNIDMKNSITSIGKNAFECCSSITTLKIPNSVKYIGESSFMSCDKIEDISIPFVGAGEETDYTTSYKNVFGYIFGYKKSSVASLLSGTVHQISVGGFYYGFYIPTSIKKVYIYGGNIREYAFKNCNFILNIELGDNVDKIGSFAFANCYNLKNLAIGKGLSEIYKYQPPFDGCVSLENITVDNDNEYYASIDGNLYSKDTKTLFLYAKGKKYTSFITPSHVENIEYYAFANCSALENITITDNVINIGEHAFESCTQLKNITIGNGITNIDNYAFANCSALENIEFGENITNIGQNVFYNCRSLANIIIPNSVQIIGYKAFYGCLYLQSIYCRNWSKPSGWSYGWNLIHEDDYGTLFATVHWGYKGK